MVWDTSKKASKIWILLGLIGIGQLIALIYSLVSKKDKDRFFGILFILGWLGDLIIYFVEKDRDKYLSSMALYLFIGEIAILVVSVLIFSLGLFTPHIISSIGSGATGFAPFLATSSNCTANGLEIVFTVVSTPDGVPIEITNPSITSATGLVSSTGGYSNINPSGTYVKSGSVVKVVFNDACRTSGVPYSASVTVNYEYTNSQGAQTGRATGTVYGISS